MTWASPKDSPRMSSHFSSHPRPLSWIVISVGLLALFLIVASSILVSYPIGAAVRGYFYGVNSSENLDSTDSSSMRNAIDVHLNNSSDPVDRKALPDLHSPTNLASPSSDSTVERMDTKSDSQVRFNESTSTKFPKTEEVKSPETSDAQSPVITSDNSPDVVNSGLPIQYNSSNVMGNATVNEPVSMVSMNKSTDISTPLNETSQYPSDSSSTAAPASADAANNASYESGCDLYHGTWVHDPLGPLYTNNSCPVLTQMQNCQGNGRPDKDYENWRWKPLQCDLPRFDPKKFLELMRGKTLAFIGDSVARNQMESMLCILWQVEAPKNRGNRHMQRYYFKSTSVMIVRIWSSWLVKHVSDPFDYAPAGVDKLHLDAPDDILMEHIPNFDVVVLSSGHWFAKQSVYILNNEIVGGQLWWPDKSRPMKINNIEAFGVSVETILTALATHPNYTGLTIVRSYSPDHYEGGAWNTGGSCTGKEKPLAPGQLVENGFTNIMHEKQVTGFNRAVKKATNKSKLRLMDITEAFSYRHDGHPGPYRNPDPNKKTKRGPDGRPPPQDCLHWCMPGPVDTWNELVFEVVRREYEGSDSS
ncbi:protein trichome birefringence-like 18 [Neltuma alba]|uniref:protein trichome birefringence-like 18 n=1 Tax=Neltuma alba TaxID=207710 RepID=UPI0010A3E60A|nr:protein trichome birefringence-like 18 [Prosopis alba]XP_028796452.1 protein trichome birefringence-like 18 [Prosopis alba]